MTWITRRPKSLARNLGISATLLALSLTVIPGERSAVAQNARPWLGVELEPARGELRGVRVRHTVRSSPAWAAGVRDGDIIVQVEEKAAFQPDDVIREVA